MRRAVGRNGLGESNWRAICVLAVWLGAALAAEAETPQVLVRAHAHNDYWHTRPLTDALEHGFASVEADVFLVDGALLVGHDASELKAERTLEALYFEPLRKRTQSRGGSVFGDGTRVTLLVDIKSEGEPTYRALATLLAKYRDMVSNVTAEKYRGGAVDVIISGIRPIELLAAEQERFAAIDGRLPDLAGEEPAHLVPLVSENWQSHFKWNGRGEFPAAERTKLREIVRRAHDQKRRVRFWATPETTECWRELLAADVDLIGTDNLESLQQFLNDRTERGAIRGK